VRKSVNTDDERRLAQEFVAGFDGRQAPRGRCADGSHGWLGRASLRQGDLRHRRGQGKLRASRSPAQRAGRPVEGLAEAAPDPGESGLQAVAKARGLAGPDAPLAPARQVQSLASCCSNAGASPYLPAIARAYEEMCDEKLGRVRARVLSATPLDIASETEIRKALERRTGKKVLMTTVVDPSLIGGVVTHVAGMVLDGSVASRLATLKNRLLN
jgi:hypothetical protein